LQQKDDKPDVHTRLMKRYEDAPGWWFHTLLVLSISISLVLCTVLRKVMQLPWWGLLFACAVPFVFTLPISIITVTTNQAPRLNVISKYIIGLILPSKPIANVVFKAYGYVSSSQAVSFLAYFKLGHYMKILPRSMFLVHVQLVGTVVAATVNLGVAYWLLGSVPNICQDTLLLANSPWTSPKDCVFFDAPVI
jgi:OPT family oligopeptide transporter